MIIFVDIFFAILMFFKFKFCFASSKFKTHSTIFSFIQKLMNVNQIRVLMARVSISLVLIRAFAAQDSLETTAVKVC